MHYIIVATHSTNNFLAKYSISKNKNYVMEFIADSSNPLSNAKENATQQVITKIKEILARDNVTATLITLVTDFNLGYSGINISPIPEMIKTINSSQERLKIVKTEDEINNALEISSIPVRLVLVGSGGGEPTEVPAPLVMMKSDDKKKYAYKNWNNHVDLIREELFSRTENKSIQAPVIKQVANITQPIPHSLTVQSPVLERNISFAGTDNDTQTDALIAGAPSMLRSQTSCTGAASNQRRFSFSIRSIATTASNNSIDSLTSPDLLQVALLQNSRSVSAASSSDNQTDILANNGLFSPGNSRASSSAENSAQEIEANANLPMLKELTLNRV